MSNTTTRNFIAIDLGATSGRVILSTLNGEDIKMECCHRFKTPMVQVCGRYYWNIYSIYEEIVRGLTIIGSKGVKVDSIGIDTWGVDVVGIAGDGTICSLPRAYRDPYTHGVQPSFYKKMPREELYRRTGTQTADINTVFQLYAMKHRERSSMLDNSKYLLFMPDAISYMLSGQRYCEYTILSTSGFMDPVRRKVDKSVLKVAGVKSRRFPSVVMPGKKVGRLTESLGVQTGLGRVPIIAVAGHDTASAVAAVPATNDHYAFLSSGTWSLMGIVTPEPMISSRTSELNFTNEGGLDGTIRLLKNITGMWILEQCLAKWRMEDKDYTYDEIASMAGACAKSQATIDVDDPMFASPTDMPAAILKYCSEHNIPAPQGDAQMMRLIYDSLAAKYAQVLSDLRSISPFAIGALHIIGGGSQNDLLNQLTADACDITVIAGPAEATAVGNVMVQARAAGMVRSLQDIRDYVRRSVTTKMFTPTLL